MDQTLSASNLELELSDLLESGLHLRSALEIEAEAQRLSAGRLNVVIVGRFKRGKSSLLNAIVGRNILPMGVVPVTAIVTLIRNGREAFSHVHFLDGRKEMISLDSLGKFVSEKFNPKNKLGVERVDLEVSEVDISPKVVLADTPGTGSVFQHNTEALKQWMGHIDAALFVLSAEPPMGEADLDLLREVRGYAGETLVILNKIDRLQGEELQEAIDYARTAVDSVMGKDTKMLFCSAKLALEGRVEESGVPELKKWIQDLAADRAEAILEKAVARRLARHLSHEIALVDLEAAAARQSANGIETAFSVLKEIRQEMGARLSDSIAIHRAGRKALIKLFDEASHEAVPLLHSRLDNELRKFAIEGDGRSLKGIQFLPSLEKQRDSLALEILQPFQEEQESALIDGFSRLSQRVLGHINELVDDAFVRAGETLGIHMAPVDIVEGFRMESRLVYRVGLPKVNLDFFSEWALMLLPPPLARRTLLWRQLRHLEDSIDRQLGLIRADLAERLNESGISFEANLRRRIEATGRHLFEALEAGREFLNSDREKSLQKLNQLEHTRAQLRKLLDTCICISRKGDSELVQK